VKGNEAEAGLTALENLEAIMIAQLTIEQSTQRGRERYEIVHKYRKYRREG
jgi:hypothetical protein